MGIDRALWHNVRRDVPGKCRSKLAGDRHQEDCIGKEVEGLANGGDDEEDEWWIYGTRFFFRFCFVT